MAQIEIGMPHNPEAEAMVLGAMMLSPQLVEAIQDRVSASDFFITAHERIFAAICDVSSKGGTPSPITLRAYCENDPDIKASAPNGNVTAYLVALATQSGVAVIGAREVAEQVAELSKRRQLIASMVDMISRAEKHSPEDSVASIMEDADCSLTAILDRDLSESSGIKQVSAATAFDEMVAAYDEPENGVRCQTITGLDDLLGPIRPHHLVIAAGRPGMGKTAFALSYANGAAQAGFGVLFVTLEMSRMELMQRATSDLIFDGRKGVPYSMIRDGKMERDDLRRVYAAGRDFKLMPFNIVDAGSLTIGRLNMIVRRWKRRMEARGQTLDLVIVDYLQLLRADGRTNGNYEVVSEVSRGLKSLAKTYDVGVMALAQLSREVEKRADKRPMLSDLRDSGQIEQDADAVLFLYREEYYLRQSMPAPGTADYFTVQAAIDEVSREIDFIVAKRRNGETGSMKASFHGAFQAVRGVA